MKLEARGFTDRAEQLSALVDGELEGSAVAGLCAQWRDDEVTRARWHDYQLIGDVLRSDDLASTAAGDSAFLSALRARLDAEPVVLAPAALAAPVGMPADLSGSFGLPVSGVVAARQRRWALPSAVAAGFVVVVAGALMVTRDPVQPTMVAKAPSPAAPVIQAVADANLPSRDATGEPPALVANGTLNRDARLDRYFAAHQQWSGGSVIGGHAAFLRHVAADAPKR